MISSAATGQLLSRQFPMLVVVFPVSCPASQNTQSFRRGNKKTSFPEDSPFSRRVWGSFLYHDHKGQLQRISVHPVP